MPMTLSNAARNRPASIDKRPPMSAPNNLFADVPQHNQRELVSIILTAANIRIERIVSTGHCSPDGFWYDQPQSEWVTVLTGHATIRFEDDPSVIDLHPGDYVNIPAHRRHRVDWTAPSEPTVWLAIHYDA